MKLTRCDAVFIGVLVFVVAVLAMLAFAPQLAGVIICATASWSVTW